MKNNLTVVEKERIDQYPWLTDTERAVFELYYRRGWRIEDITAELEGPPHRLTQRSAVDRTLKRLRQIAKEKLTNS